MSSRRVSADVLRLLAAIARLPTNQHAAFGSALGLPNAGNLRAWRIAHTSTFVQQCPPHVSFVVGNDANIGGEAADRVADFRRMLGANIVPGQADDLSEVLADYAELVARSADDARARHARTALLWEHLLAWVMPYLDSVARSAAPPYEQWARMTRDVLYLEADSVTAPQRLPLHLRVAPPAADLRAADTAEQAVRMLLTPAASGIVLTRADLARAPMQEATGCTQKGRAMTIRHLLEQDGQATLAWLGREARRQALARQSEQPRLGCIAGFWSRRAAASADALTTMAAELGTGDLKECS